MTYCIFKGKLVCIKCYGKQEMSVQMQSSKPETVLVLGSTTLLLWLSLTFLPRILYRQGSKRLKETTTKKTAVYCQLNTKQTCTQLAMLATNG